MKNFKKYFYKISSLLLTLLMVVNIFAIMPLTANAAKKTEKSYEIAIVFDNSGSMYEFGSTSWCQAKYAMEVFASMLNYENGDKLWIYPMWNVTKGEPKNGDEGSCNAISIDSKDDLITIRNLYTTKPYGTPLAPIFEAHKYLKTSKATEKWIIVLTDGEFTSEDREGAPITDEHKDLKKTLLSVATDGIKVQYLGFGQASALAPDESKNFYVPKKDDNNQEKDLKEQLIDICNNIFQRAALPSDRLSGKSLDISDLSMNNLIVFAQGSNAKISSMVNPSGKDVKVTLDSGRIQYSEITAKGYKGKTTPKKGEQYEAGIDNKLYGQVVSFDKADAGKYTLNYSGADKVEIFYEPNVKLKVEFKDASGKVVDGSKGEIEAGEYTVTSTIIDGVTEKNVTNNELLGEVNIKTYVKTSKEKEYKAYDNNAKINLTPDSATDIYVEATYLKDFTLTSLDNEELDWLTGLKVGAQSLDFKVKANVQQPENWYKISDHENWKPVKFDITVKGKPLTAEQMAKVKFSVEKSAGGKLDYKCQPLPNESAYVVYVAQDKNGKYVEPETGAYILKAQASYVDEYGSTHTADDSAMFEIQTYDKFWRWLFWILIILVLILLWLFFMTRKVLPKKISKDTGEVRVGARNKLDENFVDVSYNRKRGTITVETNDAVSYDNQASVTLKIVPVNNRFTRSKDRYFKVVNISSENDSVSIQGVPYVQNEEGVWVMKAHAKTQNPPPIDQDTINPIIIVKSRATLTGKLKNG